MAEISLNASMRSNLLSLQQTQKLQDSTQARLSTGLKVNSAIDNPSSFYTASSLNNRAEDLGALLDAMTQGIQTIKAATQALETGTAILQQAKATAVKASENSVDIVAKVNNEAELLAAVEKGGPGYIIVESNISMTNASIKLKDGQSLVGANYFDSNKATTTLTFNYDNFSDNAIEAGNNSTIANINIKVTNSSLSAAKDEQAAIKLSSVRNVTLKNLNIKTDTSGYTGPDRGYFAIKTERSDYQIKGNINITAKGENNRSILNDHGTKLEINNAIVNCQTNDVGGYGFQSYRDSIVNINGNSQLNIQSKAAVGLYLYQQGTINVNDNSQLNIQSFGSAINGDPAQASNNRLNLNDNAKFNSLSTNSLSLFAAHLSINSKNVQANLSTPASTAFFNSYLSVVTGAKISTKSGLFQSSTTVNAIYLTGTSELPSASFSKDASKPAVMPADYVLIFNDFNAYIASQPAFTKQAEYDKKPDDSSYKEILSQYDQLMNDSSYKGVNLLQQGNLKVNFNEERSSGIDIKGVDASGKGIGIQNKTWETQMDILNSVDELENAVNQLRSFSAEFGNYYSIVTTREDFTENLINVLTEGADKLTLADMNAESANMLALQTRQQLAINSLSLASQAAQSVLKLF